MTGANASDRGGGVLFVILLGGLLSAIGLGLVALSSAERAILGNYQSGVQVLYAAEALAERVIVDLELQSDWSLVLSGAATSTFSEAGDTAPWGDPVDVAGLTAQLQQETGGGTSVAPLVWRVYGRGAFETLAGVESVVPAYLVAWVGDDPADVDSDPSLDSNGVVVIRAEARAFGGMRRVVQCVVRRVADPGGEDPAGVTLVTWREVR